MQTQEYNYSNPYPFYKNLRDNHPVHQDQNGTWFLSRYDDVKILQSDPRFTREHPKGKSYFGFDPMPPKVNDIANKWLILTDPPNHTRLRNNYKELFNATFLKNSKIMIEKEAANSLEPLLKKDKFDFMKEFSYPFTTKIVNNLFGTNLDSETIKTWTQSISKAFDHGIKEDLEKVTPMLLTIYEYFSEELLKNKKRDSSQWLEKLLILKQKGLLTHEEITSTCIFLSLTGVETTQLSLNLGLRTILQNQDQLNLLQNNPKLIPSAVEEIFRYESAFSVISRWTKEEISLNNIKIPNNSLVVGLTNAANRDERKFDNPDKFDISRTNNRHLAFGHGIHHCLGALLARLELNAAFEKLLPHLHKFKIDEENIEWLPINALRYISKLPINNNLARK